MAAHHLILQIGQTWEKNYELVYKKKFIENIQ